MSKTGVGRGRGWLNLNSNHNLENENVRPGVSVLSNTPSPQTEAIIFSDASSGYTDLLDAIKKFSMNDDGILQNQKIKYILEVWTECCKNEDAVRKSLTFIFESVIHDENLSVKLAEFLTCNRMWPESIHGIRLSFSIVDDLQRNYEGAAQLQAKDPSAFRNSVILTSRLFYNIYKSKKVVKCMAQPLLEMFEMLLDSAQPDDIKVFASQLNLCGTFIKEIIPGCPEKDILNKVRLLLATNNKLTEVSRLWLLLTLEVANHRFSILPADIWAFYEEQLGDTALGNFQAIKEELRVNTSYESKKLDHYKSDVNVLQVSPLSNLSIDTSLHSNSNRDNSNNSNNFNTSGYISDTSRIKKPETKDGQNRGKTGRPILGSGARLNHPRDTKDSNRFTEKGSTGGWGKEHKSSNWDKKSPRSVNKGWEHDDRFDNYYE